MSREFKPMLNPSMFVDRDKTVENVIQIIAARSEELGCIFKKDDKFPEEVKNDVPRHKDPLTISRIQFLLRIRKEPDDYDIMPIFRHPDRYLAATYDLSTPKDNLNLKFKEYKFEEDITAPVPGKLSHQSTFHSQLSSQVKFESKNKPELDRFQSHYNEATPLVSPAIDLNELHRYVLVGLLRQ